MPDTFARMRQLIGTTTEWATNDLIIGLGEIAIERAGAEFKVKVGDGSSRFSALPYASGALSTVAWGNVTGKPSTFPPSPHHHAPEDITGLVDASGNIDMAVIPDTLKERLDWKGTHTPTALVPYPQNPAVGDTWGIAGPSFTFTTGTLAGKTVSEGAAIIYDSARWYLISGGSSANPADYVKTADLRTTTTGTTEAGKVPQLNTAGRLDPSFLDIPGALRFRGTVDITQPVPASVNQGDYYLVGIGGVAHASWVGIAGLTMLVNDQVIWNGVQWSYIRPTGAASGFLPIDGSAPMTGALALAVYTAGQPAAAHAVRKDYLDTRIGDIPTAEESLGFLPLNPANNLSEVVDDAAARTNLGLGSSATQPATAFVEKSLFLNANELLVSSGAGAVTRLAAPTADGQVLGNSGGTISWQLGSGSYLLKAQNLADVPDKALARANLGVPDLTDIILKSTIDAAGDLIVGTADNAVARLPKGAPGQALVSTAGGLAWGSSSISLFAEHVLAAPAPILTVNFPPTAKFLEFQFYANSLAQATLVAQGLVNGVEPGTTPYTTQTLFGAGSTTSAGGSSGGFWALGTSLISFGTIKIFFTGLQTFAKLQSGILQTALQVDYSATLVGGPANINGLRILNNGATPNFGAGSYLRCFAA
jgi:hypothetical protein